MPMTIGEQAGTYRLVSLSARIAGALERRMRKDLPIAGDDYVLRQGRELLNSLRDGGRAVAGETNSHVDAQAISALPAAMSTLDFLRDEFHRFSAPESAGFRGLWENVIKVLDSVLSGTEQEPSILQVSISFFHVLERILAADLREEPEPPFSR